MVYKTGLQDNNVERAADWVFSHMDELQEMDGADNDQKDNEQFRDGQGSMHPFSFYLSILVITIYPFL